MTTERQPTHREQDETHSSAHRDQNEQNTVDHALLERAIDRMSDSIRREFASALTTVAVQVGAAEKTLGSRIDGLQWRWAAALAGGQVAAGLVASYVGGNQTVVRTTHSVVNSAVGLLF